MSVKLATRQFGDVIIVDVAGRITLDGGSVSVRDKIQELMAAGYTKVILHLADTSYVDSSGIGTLISGFRELEKLGGGFKLLAPTEQVRGIFQINRLHTELETFYDETAAVRSFAE